MVILGSLDSFKVCIIIFVGDPYYEPTSYHGSWYSTAYYTGW